MVGSFCTERNLKQDKERERGGYEVHIGKVFRIVKKEGEMKR